MQKKQLSILMMTPGNQIFLKRSLNSLNQLRSKVVTELIVVDTGCGKGDREIVDAYADHVVEFTWCNDFAAARNAGLACCIGEWLLFLDDDEWFEDTTEIEDFFLNGRYHDYDAALYIQRNYYAYQKDSYQDVYKKRMIALDGNTRFEGAVHEQLLPMVERVARIPNYVHHFGYIQENEKARIRRGYRNIVIMRKMLQEHPEDMHLRIQMAQEYEYVDEYRSLEKLCVESLQLLSGTDYESYLYRGGFYCGHVYALEMMGQYEACLETCKTYLSTKCSKLTQTTLYRWMAVAGYRMKDEEICREAMDAYYRLIAEYREDAEVFTKEDMLLTRGAVTEGVQRSVAHMEELLSDGNYEQSEFDMQRIRDYRRIIELEEHPSEANDMELLELYAARKERSLQEALCEDYMNRKGAACDARFVRGHQEALAAEYRCEEGTAFGHSSEVVLSISIMTPGNNPYLEQCLKSLNHLRETIPAELVVVDTGCNFVDRAMIGAFADKVVDFTWCDDFAAARNAGLKECHGKWFLYLDDDEYLVDDQALLTFLQEQENEDVVYATFPLFNFVDETGTEYRRGEVARLYRRTDQTKFVYRIHEGIPTSMDAKTVEIASPIGHFGYIFHNDEELKAHAQRNIHLLTEVLQQEEKNNLHLVSQLVHEYQIIDDYEQQVATCEAYYEASKENEKEQAIIACGWMAGLTGAMRYDEVLGLVERLHEDCKSYASAVVTIYAYGVIAAYQRADYQQALNYLYSYKDYYDAVVEHPDQLAQEFFTRNGLEAGYYSLVMQIGVICALVLRDDEALLQVVDCIAWQDETLHLHEDLPRVLCEIIESNSFSGVVAAFLEQLLQVDTVKNAVLGYRLNTLQNL